MIELLGMPTDVSSHGHQIDQLMVWIHILMFVLFIGWAAFFAYVLIKFRASKREKADYTGVTSSTSKYLEIAVALIEGVLLVGFAIPIYSQRVDQVPDPSDALTIRVVAQQFAWNMHYAGPDGVFGRTDIQLVNEETNPLGLDRDDPNGKDDVTTINQLHIPVDRPVVVQLSSKDVIHSFNLPVLRVKQDAIPGMTIPVWFQAIKPIKSEIACAQLCGLGHYRMKGFLTVQTQAEFDAWIAEEVEALSSEEGDDFWDE